MKQLSLLFAVLIVTFSLSASAIDLKFQTSDTANFFWVVDQMSQWDARYTSPDYRKYWDEKLQLTEDDLTVLDKYARMRVRLAKLSDTKVRSETAPWVSMFGLTNMLPHEQFVLAFLESSNLNEAVLLLGLSPEDKKIVMDTMLHFGKRMHAFWTQETAYLKEYCKNADVLLSVTNAGPFIDGIKSFLGITGSVVKTIPVDALWAPPGKPRATHLNYHILLPVSLEDTRSDEAILQHLSLAMQQVVAYLLTRVSPDVLSKASTAILWQSGLIDADHPDLMMQAFTVAVGEVLFLRDGLPDLPHKALLAPLDPQVTPPYAVHVLAEGLAVELRPLMSQPGGFYPAFINKAAAVSRALFPAGPMRMAGLGVVLADAEPTSWFKDLFPSHYASTYGLTEVEAFVSQANQNPVRPAFIIVTPQDEGAMWSALNSMGVEKAVVTELKKAGNKASIRPIVRKDKATVYVVRAPNSAGLVKLLLKLAQMPALPAETITLD